MALAERLLFSSAERELVSRLVAESTEPMKSFYAAFYRQQMLVRRLSFGLHRPKGPVAPLLIPGDGPLPICGLVYGARDDRYLLELMAVNGVPSQFWTVRSTSMDEPGTFRIYAEVPSLSQELSPSNASQLLGGRAVPSAALRASGPASTRNVDDFEWRTGVQMDVDLKGLVLKHARVTVPGSTDEVWTVSPHPASNPHRSFFMVSTARALLDLLTIDRKYPEDGYCYDHVGETVYLRGTFLEAYDLLQAKSKEFADEEA